MNFNIVVAGASGFVGAALIKQLLVEYPDSAVIALSRTDKQSSQSRVEWRKCDLFSEESISQALPSKIDLVYYLVHSMEPTARLDQGSFADYDLIMADNFARACRDKGVRQLVYLGGLIPEHKSLSLHLQSRLEVETVFTEHNIPYTFLRAGLIIGEGGSSFQILLKLVTRLHVMICPSWTQTLTSPVDLPAVIHAMINVTKNARHLRRTYDLAGCGPLTYLEMMKLTAEHLDLKRFFVKVPFFSPTLSRLWVSLITNTSRYLVYPLIESLQHPMVAREDYNYYPENQKRTYSQLIKTVSTRVISKPFRFRWGPRRPTVRSVQRMPAYNQNAMQFADFYFVWLSKFTYGLITVKQNENTIRLRLLNLVTLIHLQKLTNLAEPGRVTYAISKGLLVGSSPGARLEFRQVLNKKNILVAIHDYTPSLPWFIYSYTQALAHRAVMWAFSFRLKSNYNELK